jgi:hypothetical protein
VAAARAAGGEPGGEPAADLRGALAGVAAEDDQGIASGPGALAEQGGQVRGESRDGGAVEGGVAEARAKAVGSEESSVRACCQGRPQGFRASPALSAGSGWRMGTRTETLEG